MYNQEQLHYLMRLFKRESQEGRNMLRTILDAETKEQLASMFDAAAELRNDFADMLRYQPSGDSLDELMDEDLS